MYFVNPNFQWLLAILIDVIKSGETTKDSYTHSCIKVIKYIKVSVFRTRIYKIQNPLAP